MTIYQDIQSRQMGIGGPRSINKAVGYWLFGMAVMIFVMVLLGGVTRLTQSGLSIMEWAPLMGALPPLSDTEWQRLFGLYQQTTQFHQINAQMDLVGFKGIFWWEYGHRLWGRLMGFIFFVPLAYFSLTRKIDFVLAKRLAWVFALGLLQGVIGWFMVASGFGDRVEVSQYRLALHLGMALLLYAFVFWTALDILHGDETRLTGMNPSLRRHGWIALFVISCEIIIGAFVAGLNGGLIYNTFPLMEGHGVPPEVLAGSSVVRNFFENPAAAQFLHRLMAGFVAVAVIWLTVRVRRSPLPILVKRRFYAIPCFLAIQAFLGIATLLLAVPLPLAVAHQGGAVVLLSATLFALHRIKK